MRGRDWYEVGLVLGGRVGDGEGGLALGRGRVGDREREDWWEEGGLALGERLVLMQSGRIMEFNGWVWHNTCSLLVYCLNRRLPIPSMLPPAMGCAYVPRTSSDNHPVKVSVLHNQYHPTEQQR